MAAAAESAGAASLWVSDHLLMVDVDQRNYPYSDDGRPTWNLDVEYYEAFVCCSLMAAATKTCRIGTAVLVLPQRNVLEVAKVVASIDQLSGGRFVLGVGAGWNAAEMCALGYRFDRRGKRFDEMLDILRECWSGRPQEYSGSEVRVPPGVVLSPLPAQAGGPPLLVGGMSDAALRRAAMRGDGWLAIAFARSWNAADLRERMQMLREARRVSLAGRPMQTILKLHASPAEVDALPMLVQEAAVIGFDEVAVELPWEAGTDAALAVIVAVRDAITADPSTSRVLSSPK